ncbi:MAG: sigma-70 family RNA polymerase sigma factor [Phycisphaeraceae bacterium]|nr:sigma-70 family RNA polymerase sigma factor [Phycisphaeraceae bacterium]
MTSSFVARLRAQDEAAWFELWETFGPVLRSQLMKWGKGRIGPETVRDLSQETMAALSDSIDRYDPSKGARFSTWLLAIAKHVLGDEMDRRMAQKRGGSGAGSSSKAIGRNVSLDESWMLDGAARSGPGPDAEYELAVFRAKVHAALRITEKSSELVDFEVYRMRVLEGRPGKDVADAMGMSEPTVSRRLAKVRDLLRASLAQVVATYSFTEEELQEAARNGLNLAPNKEGDSLFDEAVGEIFRHGKDAGGRRPE